MLIGKVLGSPYPHARIVSIDTSRAEKLPGVARVLTRKDVLPEKKFAGGLMNVPSSGKTIPPEFIDRAIFNDKARHLGDAIAAVAAIDEAVAEEAVNLIEVEYEQLPPVFDPVEAIKPRAPLVHDSAAGNIAHHMVSAFVEGDVDRAFVEADCVVESDFYTTKQAPCPIETATAMASFGPDGRLTIWSQCQLPHLAKESLADILGMPIGMVRLINPYVGGHFGEKLDMQPEALCALLARESGMPVKLEYTREEHLNLCHTRTGFRYNAKLGFTKDGTLIASRVKALVHCGAYLSRSMAVTTVFLTMATGNYRSVNSSAEADLVYTNTTPSYAMRGFGTPAITWGMEQLMDMAAEKLGIDPPELRRKNLKQTGDPGAFGPAIQSTALDECIRVGAKRIGWKKKRAKKGSGEKKYGIGMATMMHCSGSQPRAFECSSAAIKINGDGSANLIIHPGDAGTGTWGTLSQIAAEEIGIGIADIHVVTNDTDFTLFDVGTKASRVTYNTGTAVLRVASGVKHQLLERAASELNVATEELKIKDGRIYHKTNPETGIAVAEVGFNVVENYSFYPKTFSPPTQAAFVEVEVDLETGKVKLLNVLVANDCGRIINPTTVEGQIEGGLAQAIGWTFSENFIMDTANGMLMTDSLETYLLPTSLDLPEFEIIHVERPDPVGPFGAKGVGEAAAIALAPAIANAVCHAVGVRVTELPITPEKVLKGIEENNSENTGYMR